jgi:hypothetical protein
MCPGYFLSRGAIDQHQVIIDIRKCISDLKNSIARVIARYKRL